MEVKKITPTVTGFLEVKLDKKMIEYLWKMVEISRLEKINYKQALVGNISKSYILEDQNNYFFKRSCIPLIKIFRQQNGSNDPYLKNAILDKNTPLLLRSFWVNYQYQTEFNPYHDHTGVYSFAIWLKVPYNWQDQNKLPQFKDINESNIKAGNFEFEYIDTLGGVRNIPYKLSPSMEGTMLFFPAQLRHCVYPFYGTDEPRISIAGNIALVP